MLGAAIASALLAAPAVAEPPAPPSTTTARPAASVAPDEKAERITRAKELHDEALELYERGEYRAAITKLEAALELDPEGKELVYNLALIHERLVELDVAEKYYRRDLEMETDPKLRERTQTILKRLEGAKRQLPPKVAPPASASPLPDKPIAPRRVGPGVIVSSSLAAAALGVGAGFGISALVLNPGQSTRTGSGVSVADITDDARQAHQRAIIADVSFAVCAAAAGAALLFYYVPAPPRAAPPRAGRRLELELAASRAAVRVVF